MLKNREDEGWGGGEKENEDEEEEEEEKKIYYNCMTFFCWDTIKRATEHLTTF